MNLITQLYRQWRRRRLRSKLERLKWETFAAYYEVHDALLKNELEDAYRRLRKAHDMSEFVE